MTNENVEKFHSLGVNLEETLERFIDNEDLYFRCLHKFKDDKNFDEMALAIENKDASMAFEAAHALKGVSANLGLTYLYEEIRVITEVFRAGSLDFEPENMERLKAAYANVITVIDSL